MAQFNWTYTSESGQQHVVGLYHGPQTGHVVAYCNNRIIQIDFHVLDTKTYTFFIDDELLELKLEKKGQHFHYNFVINREADTPRNRAWKATRKRNVAQAVLMLAAMVLFVGAVGFGLSFRNTNRLESSKEYLLPNQGIQTVGRISFDTTLAFPRKVSFSFVANGQVIEGSHQLKEENFDRGMPLEPGDEFLVHYLGYKPRVHSIDLQEPSEEQIQRYRRRTSAHHARLHPELSTQQVNCQLDAAYLAKGVGGFADLYFQNRSAGQNLYHNTDTYRQLIQSEPYRQALRKACGE